MRPTIEIPPEFANLFEFWWRHAVIEGGRYSLKSHTAARYVLFFAMNSRTRTACLRQFQKNIGDSSYQLLIDLIEEYSLPFTWTNDEIRCSNGSTIIFKGLDRNVETTIKSLEGIDLVWIDEAQTITKKSIDVLTPTIRAKNSRLIWTLNRLTDLDPVISYFITDPPRKDVWHMNVDYHVAEKYGWLSDVIRDEINFAKENHPEDYAHIYLGKALNQSDKAIISVKQTLDAMSREVPDDGEIQIGVDVARYGFDRTEFVMRKGFRETKREEYTKKSVVEVCDLLENFANFNKEALIKVDDTGVGGGVTDIMVSRGYRVIPVNNGARASDPDRYPNLISEAWFYLASIIDQISISNDKDLLTELSTREWKLDSKGKRAVESKDDYKKRGYRSPDKADATILCFYTPEIFNIEDERRY